MEERLRSALGGSGSASCRDLAYCPVVVVVVSEEKIMPYFQQTLSVPANATVENVLSGSQWELAPYNAGCEFAVVAAANGIVYDITTGSDVVAEACGATVKTTPPQVPDDFLATDVVEAGQRIKVRVRNTTAAAIAVTVAMRMQPVIMR